MEDMCISTPKPNGDAHLTRSAKKRRAPYSRISLISTPFGKPSYSDNELPSKRFKGASTRLKVLASNKVCTEPCRLVLDTGQDARCVFPINDSHITKESPSLPYSLTENFLTPTEPFQTPPNRQVLNCHNDEWSYEVSTSAASPRITSPTSSSTLRNSMKHASDRKRCGTLISTLDQERHSDPLSPCLLNSAQDRLAAVVRNHNVDKNFNVMENYKSDENQIQCVSRSFSQSGERDRMISYVNKNDDSNGIHVFPFFSPSACSIVKPSYNNHSDDDCHWNTHHNNELMNEVQQQYRSVHYYNNASTNHTIRLLSPVPRHCAPLVTERTVSSAPSSSTPSPRTPVPITSLNSITIHSPPRLLTTFIGDNADCYSSLSNTLEGLRLPPTPQAPLRRRPVSKRQLLHGILTGNKREVMIALDNGEDPNSALQFPPSVTGKSEYILPILAASRLCHSGVIQSLLNGGAVIDSVNSKGQNSLHILFSQQSIHKKKTDKDMSFLNISSTKKQTVVEHDPIPKAWLNLQQFFDQLDQPSISHKSRIPSDNQTTKVPSSCSSSHTSDEDNEEEEDLHTPKPLSRPFPKALRLHDTVDNSVACNITESDILLCGEILIEAGISKNKIDLNGKTPKDSAIDCGFSTDHPFFLKYNLHSSESIHLSDPMYFQISEPNHHSTSYTTTTTTTTPRNHFTSSFPKCNSPERVQQSFVTFPNKQFQSAQNHLLPTHPLCVYSTSVVSQPASLPVSDVSQATIIKQNNLIDSFLKTKGSIKQPCVRKTLHH